MDIIPRSDGPNDPGEVTQRMMISQPRSGTHWLKFMISRILGQAPLDARLDTPEDVSAALETEAPHRLVYEHLAYDSFASVLDPAVRPRLRLLVLYRNPVDARISAFNRFAHFQNLQLPDPELDAVENFRLYLRGHWRNRLPTGKAAQALVEIPFQDWVRNWSAAWVKRGGCLPVRYEDLVRDTENELERVLRYLRIDYTTERIRETVSEYAFEKLSGGRARGTVDVGSHYRRGQPGEWTEALDERDLAEVNLQIGDYLEVLGYRMVASDLASVAKT